MVHLPSILHSRNVSAAIPTLLNNTVPPAVSYTYSKTIASKIVKLLLIWTLIMGQLE